MKLRENTHRALHTVFADSTPLQRIRRTLEADKPVLLPWVYKAISDTLRRFEKQEIDVYEKDCFNSDKFLKKQKNELYEKIVQLKYKSNLIP